MKRQDQTVPHNPPETYGDCFRTTIANLLGLDSSDVPHFLVDGCDGAECNRRLNEWLRQFGLAFLSIGGGLPREFRERIGVSGVWHEAGGLTERGFEHAAAFCDDKLEHDPHPSHAGFTELAPEWGVFIVLRPWEFISGSNAGAK